MKKCLYLLLIAVCLNVTAKGAPGDTTWVQANITNMDGYGSFDSTVTFPAAGTTYRKIYMIFTLGKHTCPGYTYGTGSVPWCADWDYTVQNYLMTPGGDTLELGRFITPYANGGGTDPRTPYTLLMPYIFDVTDYASKLQNRGTVRIFFSGYSGGFTANVKFAFIEGTPDRNVLGIIKLWNGSFGYGDTTHLDSFDINTHFPAMAETAPAGTASTDLKFTVTGHGSDPVNGCCEFYPNSYQVYLNSISVVTQPIWRTDCGANELYPQSGTWIYQRGNWCPGALVYPNFHNLPGVVGGSSYNVDIQFPPYVHSGGSYTTFATIFYHGAMNKVLDVSLDQIIAPSGDQNHFRENPSEDATIHVKNTGSTTITDLRIQYAVDGAEPSIFTWTGSLAALQETDIRMPELWQQRVISGTAGTHSFTAQILQANGVADDDKTNNSMTSSFFAAPQWPMSFKIVFRTNNETDASGNCETVWQITDLNDVVITQRINSAINTTFTDTVNVGPGAYKLKVFDTTNCDGLAWWGFPSGTTSGSIGVKQMSGTNIPLNGNYTGQYANDFGCGFVQYFTTNWPTAITNISGNVPGIEAYPNPAGSMVNVEISGMQQVSGNLQVIDALGRVVSEIPCNNTHQQLDVASFANGVYTIVFINTSGNRVQTRLIIAK